MISNLRNNLKFAAVLATAATAFAQTAPLSILMGDVRTGAAFIGEELTVDVETAIGHHPSAQGYVRADGSFEIRNVPIGSFQVSVQDGRGGVLWQGWVQVTPGATQLTIELDREVRQTAGSGTVSVTRLRHRPSAAAMREFRLAEKATAQHKIDESSKHLCRALELSPDMQDARNNLGANYLRLGDYSAARREFETAIALDPDAAVPHANLALALLALGHPDEAEAEARIALRRDPLSAAAQFAANAARRSAPTPLQK